MLLLISACNIPWWAVLLGMVVPAVLAWMLRGVFIDDTSLDLQQKVKKLEVELKRCYEEKMSITTTQVSPKVKFSDVQQDTIPKRSADEGKVDSIHGKHVEKSHLKTRNTGSKTASSKKSEPKSQDQKKYSSKDVSGKSKLVKTAAKKSVDPKASSAKRKRQGSSGVLYPKLQDNLQVCEGIGPKMEEILKENGIKKWDELGSATPKKLRNILSKYGDRYRIIDPKDWPKQAQLLNKGEWDKLIKLQSSLGGGKDQTSPSKAAKLLTKYGYRRQHEKDDLKLIEGIGPKIAELLIAANIKTWHELSETSTNTLNQILEKAGKRYALAKPESWPAQAKLAAEGDFNGLEQLQSKLKGGR